MSINISIPPREEKNTVCFTGHRYLSAEEIRVIRRRLRKAIDECYRAKYRWFICGGALGFDTLAAQEILNYRDSHPDIGLFLAVPCADQASRWSDADRKTYHAILDQADEVKVLSPTYYEGCMHLRNQFMVQHASLCICYLRRFSGGTGYTVRYALTCDRNIINLCLPEQADSVRVKEPTWNSIFTFPSVSENVLTARLIHSRAAAGRKWNGTSLRLSGKSRNSSD